MEYKAITEDDPRASLMHWKYLEKRKVNGKWQYVYETPTGKKGPGTYTHLDSNKNTNTVNVKPSGVISITKTGTQKNDEEYFRGRDKNGYLTTMNIQGEIGKVTKKNTKTGVISTTGKATDADSTSNTIQGEIKKSDKLKSVSKTTISKGKKAVNKILKRLRN